MAENVRILLERPSHHAVHPVLSTGVLAFQSGGIRHNATMDLWRVELIRATRESQTSFESMECITDEAHGRTAAAVLRAFQFDPAAILYAEPRTPDRAAHTNPRPTDLFLLHPSLGALLLEVKSWPISIITGIEAGNLRVCLGGVQELLNPWQQAAKAATQVQAATRGVMRKRRLVNEQEPWFDWIVAFPKISRREWSTAGFTGCLHECELLFADDLADPLALRQRLLDFISAKAGKRLPYSPRQIGYVREALGSSYVIRERIRQSTQASTQQVKAAEIDSTEVKQKRLSGEQIELIETEFDGRPQLIRGVAGSGKSVVLVKNCARFVERLEQRTGNLFAPSPPARVAIVCFNRALVPFLRRSFDQAFHELAYRAPAIHVDVAHLSGLQYLLSTTSKEPGALLIYQGHGPYKAADPENYTARIATAYSHQLNELASTNPTGLASLRYDAIYVDESQDLFPEEFLFLMHLLRPNPENGNKNIVLFYDDAQNIYARPRPTWSDLGIQVVGRTAIMQTCFRNTCDTVQFAFNLLLGSAAETRAKTRTFAEVAYLKEKQLVTELPDRWLIHFAQRTGEPPQVTLFASRAEERLWVQQRLHAFLNDEGVRAEDIVILFDGKNRKGHFNGFEQQLRTGNCSNVNVFVPPPDTHIFREGSVTVTTVQSAKGYDVPIVFLVGADLFESGTEGRATFYVGATRAKMRLFVTGLAKPASLAIEATSVASLLNQVAPTD